MIRALLRSAPTARWLTLLLLACFSGAKSEATPAAIANLQSLSTNRLSDWQSKQDSQAAEPLRTSYSGAPAGILALEQRRATPVALATADLDEDGIPDLLCGYSFEESGLVVVYRGNPDAIYPHSPDARRRRLGRSLTGAPFLLGATVYATGQAPTSLATGDFDGDGHIDVVTASDAGGEWLAGDGRGHLVVAATPVPAAALRLAERMRQTPGVDTIDGSQSGPGATLQMRLNSDGLEDTVILEASGEVDVLLTRAATTYFVNSSGDTPAGDPNDGVCLTDISRGVPPCSLRAAIQKANAHPGNDTIDFSNLVGVVIQPASALPPVTEAVSIDGTTNKLGIVELNGALAPQTPETRGLVLNAAGVVVRGLSITGFGGEGVLIQGPGHDVIEGCRIGLSWDGAVNGNGDDGIDADAGGNTIGGLSAAARNVITGNGDDGIDLDSGGNLVAGNRIGTDVAGMTCPSTRDTAGNGDDGVEIQGSTGNTIGGTTPGAANQISCNFGHGIHVFADSSGNTIQRNRIGTDVSGRNCLGNFGNGILVEGFGALLGGTLGEGNLISCNQLIGVALIGAGAHDNVVQGNRIGTDGTGGHRLPNESGGLLVDASPNNTVGGPDGTFSSGPCAGACNLISGNSGSGIVLQGVNATTNEVFGNFIGTDVTGTFPVSNDLDGLTIQSAPLNQLGGAGIGRGNLISGNARNGVFIKGGPSSGNVLQGNRIGTTAAGTTPLPNGQYGVRVEAGTNSIGGAEGTSRSGQCTGACNLISGNNVAGVIFIGTTATGNRVKGNFIGTDVSGSISVGNGDGVVLDSTQTCVVGGVTPGEGNLISGNFANGVFVIRTTSMGNSIFGNRIGTDASGTSALGNRATGVTMIDSPNIVIGGADGTTEGVACTGACNLISGNSDAGIRVLGPTSSGSVVRGNFIGTNVTGTAAVPNGGQAGVDVRDARNILIGGLSQGEANLVSGNLNNGIGLSGVNATQSRIFGNQIGTSKDGSPAPGLGNGMAGIFVDLDSSDAQIQANTIAGNGNAGVFLSQPAGGQVEILQNSIFSNGALGIDLNGDGVTPPDPNDADSGPNGLQNQPELTSVTAGNVGVHGTIDTLANRTMRIELFHSSSCDPSGSGEGQTFLSATSVITNASGHAAFIAPVARLVSGGVFTATATDEEANTSEFSSCVEAPVLPVPALSGGWLISLAVVLVAAWIGAEPTHGSSPSEMVKRPFAEIFRLPRMRWTKCPTQ